MIKYVDTVKSIVTNPSNRKYYWLIAVVLLSIACFLLVVVVIIKYCVKRQLTIPSLSAFMDY